MNAAADPASVFDDEDPSTVELLALDPDATGEYPGDLLVTLLAFEKAIFLKLDLEL